MGQDADPQVFQRQINAPGERVIKALQGVVLPKGPFLEERLQGQLTLPHLPAIFEQIDAQLLWFFRPHIQDLADPGKKSIDLGGQHGCGIIRRWGGGIEIERPGGLYRRRRQTALHLQQVSGIRVIDF